MYDFVSINLPIDMWPHVEQSTNITSDIKDLIRPNLRSLIGSRFRNPGDKN